MPNAFQTLPRKPHDASLSAQGPQCRSYCLLPVVQACAWLILVLPLVGCSRESETPFAQLEFLPPQEEVVEMPLGRYSIPVPTQTEQKSKRPQIAHRVHLEFELQAVVSPVDETAVMDAWQRHEGRIRDQIITICRNASVEDLSEPDLVSLKIRLLDATEPLLGLHRVQTLLMPQVQMYEL